MTDIQNESMGIYAAQYDTLARFDYGEVDSETAEYLKQRESVIMTKTKEYLTEIGKMLFEAQTRLANHKEGIFEKWYLSLGMKKRGVYNLINRYKMIASLDSQDRKIIEELPATLSYSISSPNAPERLVEKVLGGEITTDAQYQKEKKQADSGYYGRISEYKRYMDVVREWELYQNRKWSDLTADEEDRVFDIFEYLLKKSSEHRKIVEEYREWLSELCGVNEVRPVPDFQEKKELLSRVIGFYDNYFDTQHDETALKAAEVDALEAVHQMHTYLKDSHGKNEWLSVIQGAIDDLKASNLSILAPLPL